MRFKLLVVHISAHSVPAVLTRISLSLQEIHLILNFLQVLKKFLRLCTLKTLVYILTIEKGNLSRFSTNYGTSKRAVVLNGQHRSFESLKVLNIVKNIES